MADGGGRLLFWGSGSVPSWRVLATLAEKRLPYESRLVDFAAGEHKGPEVTALNPRGQLPTFRDEGAARVNESLAALLYLEQAYPQPPLMPQDRAGYGLVLQRLMETINLSLAFRPVSQILREGRLRTAAERAVWLEKVQAAKEELGLWEGYLEAGGFIAGPALSLADLALGPFLLAARRSGATFEAFPRLRAYVARMAAWPSLAQTAPPHWKTSEGSTALEGYL